MSPPLSLALREELREQRFSTIWKQDLHDIFVDVAPYYDRANYVASLGLFDWFRSSSIAAIEVAPGQRVLDVCAGTNAVGIELLKREPSLEVHAMDRSAAMQLVGQERAQALGLHIESVIGDVHRLPFPDHHFDVVTLQYATRHLRVKEIFSEIHRVLKPGGSFHHCDMLRPGNAIVEKLYYGYLRGCLAVTGLLFRSGTAAMNAKKYFIDALEMFYSADELSEVLRHQGFCDVSAKTLLAGMIGFHRAVKPQCA
jgi:demethylmenaquinone methyltransferase/2-methoxy-6-polyprenyl-1,4-benzoquinol methylase